MGIKKLVNDSLSGLTGYHLTKKRPDTKPPPRPQRLAAPPKPKPKPAGLAPWKYPTDYDDRDVVQVSLLMEGVIRAVNLLELNESLARSQAEIRQMNEALELQVQRRTSQFEAANQELEAFSYSVSHDLRGPLRGIDGFSGALLSDYRDCLDPTGQHYLTRIRQGAQRMGQLIEDLLKLSRINRNGLELTIVNMSGLCHQVVGELLRANPERQFQVVIEPGLVVRADRRMLQVVLENLLGNAWKFTARSAQPRVEVGATTRTDGSPCWFIQDNGAGFDMEYAGKLFQPFQRLHANTDYEGTGIGLAIVQRIIHRHGGEVWAEATPGLGATFYFSLPGLET